jgi:hypothetical protein
LQKISLGKEAELTDEEEAQLSRFLLPTQVNTENQSADSFATTILKEASKKLVNKYINVNFIPPGSVIVESLFSMVGHMFDQRRLSSSPVHVEEQVFLRANRNLWNMKALLSVESEL